MTIMSLDALAAGLPASSRLIGLDPGSKTVGVALSDPSRMVASPTEHLKRGKFRDLAARLEALVKTEEVGGLVVGLPLNMDGSEGARCQSTRAFARNFDRLGDIPIGFWDERLSTVAAERALLEADTSRRRRAEVIDHVAAGYILQGVLDRLRVIKAQGASA